MKIDHPRAIPIDYSAKILESISQIETRSINYNIIRLFSIISDLCLKMNSSKKVVPPVNTKLLMEPLPPLPHRAAGPDAPEFDHGRREPQPEIMDFFSNEQSSRFSDRGKR